MPAMVLDIGGTAIKSGIYADNALSEIRETPTNALQGGEYVVNRIKEIISDYKKNHAFDYIGISTAGQVDPTRGEIIYANDNIPGYTGMKLKEIMEKEFNVPTAVENDVNAAAIGEAVFGAGRGIDDFICLTYGTGIGGAIFAGGKLYHGSSCSAGEFGAIVTHPEARDASRDMLSGCYERYASTAALVNSAMRIDKNLTNGRKIFERVSEPEIQMLIDDWIMEITYGLVSIIHALNPSRIIIGGGIMEQPYVIERLRQKIYVNIIPSFAHNRVGERSSHLLDAPGACCDSSKLQYAPVCMNNAQLRITKAQLGNRAGMLGAAVLMRAPAQ